MIITENSSRKIISAAYTYLGRPYDWKKFDCVHFVIAVYRDAGISIPIFGSKGYPPTEFHLSLEEFTLMPIGHSVFFKRKANTSDRLWTHMAIIVSSNELIHCTRHFGGAVVVTSKVAFMEIYNLAPKQDTNHPA